MFNNDDDDDDDDDIKYLYKVVTSVIKTAILVQY